LCAGVPSIVRTGLTTGLREPDEFKASEESRAKESQIKYRDTIRESHKSRVLMVVEGETGGGRERERVGEYSLKPSGLSNACVYFELPFIVV
jgi:hypothetical protein